MAALGMPLGSTAIVDTVACLKPYRVGESDSTATLLGPWQGGDIMKRRTFIGSFAATLVVGAGNAWAGAPRRRRPAAWAVPVAVAGAPNLHHVTTNFFRSAQPEPEGFRRLANQYGVRSVVCLRAFHSDVPLIAGLPLRLYTFGMHTWHIEREDVVGALHALRTSMARAPTLVHCEHGADRTGLITALYRVLYQGWSKDRAIDEMENGQFGFHDVWINIPAYIRDTDTAKLKRDVEALTT